MPPKVSKVQSVAQTQGVRYAENRTGQDLDGDGHVGKPPRSSSRRGERSERSDRRHDTSDSSTQRRSERNPTRTYDDNVTSSNSGRSRRAASPTKAKGSFKSPPQNHKRKEVPQKEYEVWPPPGMMYYVDEDPPRGKLERRPPSPPEKKDIPRRGSRTVKITNLSETSVPISFIASPGPNGGTPQNYNMNSPFQQRSPQPQYAMSPQQLNFGGGGGGMQMHNAAMSPQMAMSPQGMGYGMQMQQHAAMPMYPQQQMNNANQMMFSPGPMSPQMISPQRFY